MSHRSVFATGPYRYGQYAALIILMISSLAVAGRSYLVNQITAANQDIPPVKLDYWNGQQPVAAVISLRPTGFEPHVLNVPAGRVLIMVENRSGLSEMVLKLGRQTDIGPVTMLLAEKPQDQVLKKSEVRVLREKPTWGNVVEFTPGKYILSESNHPKWKCEMIVSER